VSVDVRPELEIDPLRLRAGSADASGGFRVDGIRDWIAATLARDLSRMFSGVALVDANGFAVAQYSNMFLIHIGLIDPARTVQISFPTRFGPLTFIRIGFDLIMREGRPPL
jgi:hypothetical protein